MIQITWNEGRTVEQKKALYKTIADWLSTDLSIRRGGCLDQRRRGQERERVVRQRSRAVRGVSL
jgi:hypothetical protein